MSKKFKGRKDAELRVGLEKLKMVDDATKAFRNILGLFDAHILLVAVCVHRDKNAGEAVTMVSGEKENPELHEEIVAVLEKYAAKGETIH